jgi:hypothetical protein
VRRLTKQDPTDTIGLKRLVAKNVIAANGYIV